MSKAVSTLPDEGKRVLWTSIKRGCKDCYQRGWITNKLGTDELCRCTLLSVFGDIEAHYFRCLGQRGSKVSVSCSVAPGLASGMNFSMTFAEFAADFELLCRRVAREFGGDHLRVFTLISNADATPEFVARRIGSTEDYAKRMWRELRCAIAAHAIYMKPYALFPTVDYHTVTVFSGAMPVESIVPAEVRRFTKRGLVPPLREAS
jgi:hypothetical protein